MDARKTIRDVGEQDEQEVAYGEGQMITEVLGDHPKTKMLAVLLSTGQDLTITQLANQSGITRTTVYRHIDPLLKVGLIEESRTDGNSTYYQINQESDLARELARFEWELVDENEHDPEEDMPNWVPDSYDPDAPLVERLPIMAGIMGAIELHVKGENGVIEIVGRPKKLLQNDRYVRLDCGTSSDNWEWEIVVPKGEDSAPPRLDHVDPMQPGTVYSATKDVEYLRNVDVRIYGVDAYRLYEDQDQNQSQEQEAEQ